MPLISTFAAGSTRGFGQFGATGGGGVLPVSTDTNFRYINMLLSTGSTNGSNNNVFLDSSSSPYTVLRNGNATQGTFTPYGNNWSNYFDGDSDRLSVTNNAAFQFGTGDYTIECWVYIVAATSFGIIVKCSTDGAWSSGWSLAMNSAGNGFTSYHSGINTTTGFATNRWIHLAVVRSGSTETLWVDGISAATATYTTSLAPTSLLTIGADITATNYEFNGYISNLRIVKGSAVYTTPFTPSSSPLTAISGTSLLTCNSNRFSDSSTNNFTVTKNGDVSVNKFSPFAPSSSYSAGTNGGSAYFDGTGDYLRVASGTPLNFGTNNFTVEFWIYPTKLGAAMVFLSSKDNATQSGDIDIRCDYIGASSTVFYIYGGGTNFSGSFTGNILNRWTHVALVRNGSTVTFYLNGVSVGTGVGGTQGTVNLAAVNIGGGSGLPAAGYEGVTGYISGFRAVNGSAVYTAAFTPPTAPPSNISNTTFLANFTNAGIFDSAMMNDVETITNAQVSTAQSKFGGSSMYFDGSSYLNIPLTTEHRLGSSDFTLEFFMNATGSISGQAMMAFPHNASNYASLLIYGGGATALQLYSSSAGSSWDVAGGSSIGTITAGVWHHVAIARQGSSIRLFLDGNLTTTISFSGTYSGTYDRFWIGDSVSNSNYVGYIDELRFTRGVARYTSTFTPATSAFSTF